jgi:polyferredoxin
MNIPVKDTEDYRDKVATVDEAGKRVWIYPKKPQGPLTRAREILALFLLLFLFIAPFLKVNGHQLLQFDILNRKFIIFGILFWPQDFYLFVLASLTLIVFIILFTVALGRLWCGWACPQTIFMEMVFRKIEYCRLHWPKLPGPDKKLSKRQLSIFYFMRYLFLSEIHFLPM